MIFGLGPLHDAALAMRQKIDIGPPAFSIAERGHSKAASDALARRGCKTFAREMRGDPKKQHTTKLKATSGTNVPTAHYCVT
jgi:hypothetical protein